MPAIDITFSGRKADQECLSKAGGFIAFKKDIPVFRFHNQEAYRKFRQMTANKND